MSGDGGVATEEKGWAPSVSNRQLSREAADAFGNAPDTGLAVAIKQGLLYGLVQEAPQIRAPIADGRISMDGRMLHITGAPPQASYVLEYQRSAGYTGNAFTYGVPDITRLFAVYDKEGEPLGSFLWGSDQLGKADELLMLSHEDALGQSGISLMEPIPPSDIEEYLRRAPEIFAPEGELNTRTGLGKTMEKIPLEFGVRLMKHLESLRGDTHRREELYAFIHEHEKNALISLFTVKSPDELLLVLDAASNGDSRNYRAFLDAYAHTVGELEQVDMYAPSFGTGSASSYLGEILHSYFLGVHKSMVRGYMDWNIAQMSMHAFSDLLNGAYGLTIPPRLEGQLKFRGSLTEFVLQHGNDPDALAVIQPVVVELWLDELVSYNPGERETARRHFYETLGMHLEENASESTGDTEQELDRFEAIFRYLTRSARVPAAYRLLDVGSKSGSRILAPLLDRLERSGEPPSDVVAMDIDQYEAPDGRWSFVQADFRADNFPAAVGGPFEVILHGWSPINDWQGPDQQRALNNFSRVLEDGGYLVLDVPGGYEAEKLAYYQEGKAHAIGAIQRQFVSESGEPIAKEFTINELYDLLVRAYRAGFQVVNLPESDNPVAEAPTLWTTRSGNDRATLLFKKISDPQPTLDLLLVGAGKSG